MPQESKQPQIMLVLGKNQGGGEDGNVINKLLYFWTMLVTFKMSDSSAVQLLPYSHSAQAMTTYRASC